MGRSSPTLADIKAHGVLSMDSDRGWGWKSMAKRMGHIQLERAVRICSLQPARPPDGGLGQHSAADRGRPGPVLLRAAAEFGRLAGVLDGVQPPAPAGPERP